MREKVKYLQSSQQLLPKKEKKKKREYGKKKKNLPEYRKNCWKNASR